MIPKFGALQSQFQDLCPQGSPLSDDFPSSKPLAVPADYWHMNCAWCVRGYGTGVGCVVFATATFYPYNTVRGLLAVAADCVC
jgi:hypothetical protein